MMYFVTRVNLDQQGHQSNSIQLYTDLVQAQKRWHTVIAADIDNENYQYELVQIVGEDGIVIASQVLDNRQRPAEV